MLVPGSPRARNAFIALDDVAAAVERAVGETEQTSRTLEVGGPEVLTWTDVAAAYSDVLDRRVRVVSTPAPVYALAAAALRPLAPVPSSTMALNHFVASIETTWPPGGGGLVDPATMTTTRAFLARKASLPAQLPNVV